ncbi:MAG: DUF1566 domain-containing protein [bacterium]|nr:DUF1566 domain-containing protein [bacterium]
MNIKVMKAITGISGTLFIGLLFICSPVFAGWVPTETPESYTSYSLEDIFDRLDTGKQGTRKGLRDWKYGPSGTGSEQHTLNDIMGTAPKESANPAGPEDVMLGKDFWGLKPSVGVHETWGLKKGTMQLGVQATGWDDECFEEKIVDIIIKNNPAQDVIFERVPCNGATNIHLDQDGNPMNGYSRGVVYNPPEGMPELKFRFKINVKSDSNGHLAGTVTDNLTGLVWTRFLNCPIILQSGNEVSQEMDWQDAIKSGRNMGHWECGGLLQDSSNYGDWHLPTIRELLSLVDFSGNDIDEKTGKITDRLALTQCVEGNRTYSPGEAKCKWTIDSNGEKVGVYPFENLNISTELWSSTTTSFVPEKAWKLVLRNEVDPILQKKHKYYFGSVLYVRKQRPDEIN